MKNSLNKKILLSILALIILALGCAFQVKAEVGLGPWDALTATLSDLTKLKFGTASMISNVVMLALQLIILKSKFKLSYWTQVPIILGFGLVVNFFLYQVLAFDVQSYIGQMFYFIIGIILAAFAIAILVKVDLILMPVEGFCSALAKVSRLEFSKIRLGVDIVSTAFCLFATFVLGSVLAIREGTILSIVLFNLFLTIFLKVIGKKLEKI